MLDEKEKDPKHTATKHKSTQPAWRSRRFGVLYQAVNSLEYRSTTRIIVCKERKIGKVDSFEEKEGKQQRLFSNRVCFALALIVLISFAVGY